jgi:vacuolar protein sorting-associated protein 26
MENRSLVKYEPAQANRDMSNAVLTGFPRIKVTVRLRDGRKLAHDGIKIEFIGSIGTNGPAHTLGYIAYQPTRYRCPELFYDRGNHYEFLSLSQELAAPGEMRQAQTFDFHFKSVEKQFESYQGINVKLRCVHVSKADSCCAQGSS